MNLAERLEQMMRTIEQLYVWPNTDLLLGATKADQGYKWRSSQNVLTDDALPDICGCGSKYL